MMWNVRLKLRFPNFKMKDGRKVNEHIFVVKGIKCPLCYGREDCIHCKANAFCQVVDMVFSGRELAKLYIRESETWPAEKLRKSQMEDGATGANRYN